MDRKDSLQLVHLGVLSVFKLYHPDFKPMTPCQCLLAVSTITNEEVDVETKTGVE